MGETTRNSTTKYAFCVVGGVVRDGAKISTSLFERQIASDTRLDLPGVPLPGWCEVGHDIIYTNALVM